jgi:hypothetical protein
MVELSDEDDEEGPYPHTPVRVRRRRRPRAWELEFPYRTGSPERRGRYVVKELRGHRHGADDTPGCEGRDEFELPV